jgi:hypothetical protein
MPSTSSQSFWTPPSSHNPTNFPAPLNTYIPPHSVPSNDEINLWFDNDFDPHMIDQFMEQYWITLEGTSEEPLASHKNNPTLTEWNLQYPLQETQTAQNEDLNYIKKSM